jgi:hypothetical protein
LIHFLWVEILRIVYGRSKELFNIIFLYVYDLYAFLIYMF